MENEIRKKGIFTGMRILNKRPKNASIKGYRQSQSGNIECLTIFFNLLGQRLQIFIPFPYFCAALLEEVSG